MNGPAAPPPSPAPLGARGWTTLAALLVLAALLRLGGMSHDLHEGRIYHPDVAKQLEATRRFVRGRYYEHVGKADYDGYPLLHAHLAELAIRAAEPVRRGALRLAGVPPGPGIGDDLDRIAWATLLMNALLSTLAVAVVFRIGREHFGPGVGWGAAALQALSPADVTAAHLPTGDVATAFFASLALLFALDLWRHGRRRDYVLAGVAASLSFAAKYYAASVVFAVAAAHLARQERLGDLLRPPALRRVALAAAAAVATLFVAIPTLVGHFAAEARAIFVAMTQSARRFPAEVRNAGWWGHFVYSMRVNLPDLARVLGPLAAAAPLAAPLTRLRHDPRLWILLAGPAAYLLFAVGSRGMVNPVYHTVATAPLFLAAAWLAARAWDAAPPARLPARAAAAFLLGLSAWLLAGEAGREVFFQRRADTRRLGEAWLAENVPRSFAITRDRYALAWVPGDVAGAWPKGTVFARSGLAGREALPAGVFPVKRFELERRPLTQFRNVGQEALLGRTTLVREGFTSPPGPRWPSGTGNEFLFANGRELLRGETLFDVAPGAALERWLVADRPLAEAWVVARAPSGAAEVAATLGGRAGTLRLGAGEAAAVRLETPRAGFPSRDGLLLYRFRVAVGGAGARVLLATRPGEAGRMLLAAGRAVDAAPLLERGALEERDPAAAALAAVAARRAGRPGDDPALAALAARTLEVIDEGSFLEVYGVHPAYLDALPFVAFGEGELGVNGFHGAPLRLPPLGEAGRELLANATLIGRDRSLGYAFWTPDLALDPGAYAVRVFVRSLGTEPRARRLRVFLQDPAGAVLGTEREAELPAPDTRPYTAIAVPLEVPSGAPAARVVVRVERPQGLAFGGLEIRPDPLANALALAAALRADGGLAPAAGAPPQSASQTETSAR